MSDRSPSARQRPSLAQTHRVSQVATYVFAAVLAAVLFTHPELITVAAKACRQFIALILN